jgi:type IV pilus assembly protein PilV
MLMINSQPIARRRCPASQSVRNSSGPHRTCTRKQTGFSLIEVLVAMLVLAIGLLGLAALQTQGVRFNHDAYVRTSATSLAYDIVDKMRINRADPSSYTTANFPTRNTLPTGGYTVEKPPYDCTGADTKVADIQTDLACWLNGIELSLPLGQATISQQVAPNADMYDISIFWLDRIPRNFGGTSRLAQSETECEAATNRTWIVASTQCFVTQTWTVWP